MRLILVSLALLSSCSAYGAELLPLTGKHAEACKAELGPRYRAHPFVACIDGKVRAEREAARKASEACQPSSSKKY